jgi:tetratricopeptide (TPR) repeat protein
MKTFEKADRALAEGSLWRAREILEGSIPNLGYNLQLYERLGLVLLRMGDMPRAGRFLFLSGARKPEYEEAVALYRNRYAAGGVYQLLATFPHNARLASLSDYPATVASTLRDLGLPENLSLRILERADQALRKGHAGRAKEILEGALRSVGYRPSLYVMLGEVLLLMGEQPRAGMFLLLSGVRKEEYREAIERYKQKFAVNGVCQSFSAFPDHARLASLSYYPKTVAVELRELGLPEDLRDLIAQASSRSSPQKGPLESCVSVACFPLAALVIAMLLVGIGLLIAGIVKVVELLF